MKENLDKILDKIYPYLGRKSREEIFELCEKTEVVAGTTFIEKGKQDKYEYFLEEGVVRSSLMNQEGELITLSFFDGPDILSPHVTRTQDRSSLLNFEAVTGISLLRMEAVRFEKLIENNLEIREFANIVLRQELFKKINKEIRLVSWTSRERLDQFRKDYHMLENRVPHTMIATYLGITNVSLSRLRRGV